MINSYSIKPYQNQVLSYKGNEPKKTSSANMSPVEVGAITGAGISCTLAIPYLLLQKSCLKYVQNMFPVTAKDLIPGNIITLGMATGLYSGIGALIGLIIKAATKKNNQD